MDQIARPEIANEYQVNREAFISVARKHTIEHGVPIEVGPQESVVSVLHGPTAPFLRRWWCNIS